MKYLFNDGFHFLRTPLGTTYQQASGRLEEFQNVDIPHDWLIYDSNKLYEDGIGWYEKRFFWKEPEGKRAFLTFEGIYMDSTVYVNGSKVGEWKYGYSSLTFEITDYLVQGENQLFVSVCFQSPNSRWYSGAGIYRNVYLRVTESVCLKTDGIYVSAKRQGDDFMLRVETQILDKKTEQQSGADDAGMSTSSITIKHRLYEKTSECSGDSTNSSYTITAGNVRGAEVSLTLVSQEKNVLTYLVNAPRLWDTENPFLYTLHTQLYDGDQLLEEEDTTVGFRTVELSPEHGFYLNGRNMKLNGVCEHHDLGAVGAAFNRSAMKRKFRILKEMGVNAVRGAHNMMAPDALDLADEMGILLISEAFDMWERPKTTYDYGRFFGEWWQKDVESWVCRDRNHPSVILWSIGNEIYDTHAGERGQEITRMLSDAVHTYDPEGNAAVTIGSNYMPWENAQKCADIIKIAGYNYSEKYYKEHHEKHPDWIIYGSETSSIVQSRGIYHFPLKEGILGEDDEQCSALGNSPASWGARSVEDCITIDRDMGFSMGQFIWSGFDYIGEPTPYHTKNSYFGQVDTAGFPKDSYYVWQSAWTDYREKPMVHIFPYWDFNVGQMIDVRVCSNCPYVELYLNGKSLGRKKISHGAGSGRDVVADYQVSYEEGILEAVALDEEGREVIRQARHSFGDSHRLVIIPENTEARADGREMLFLQIGAQDIDGNPVDNACDRVTVEVSGAGRLVGLDNGDSTDFDSYKGVSRRLFNGKLLAMIQAGFTAGDVRVRVSAEGLQSAEITLHVTIPARPVPEAYGSRDEDGNLNGGAEEHGYGLTAQETCVERPVVLGHEKEIPVRKVEIIVDGERIFTPERRTIEARAVILPQNAEDREVIFKAVNDSGVPSNLVTITQEGDKVTMTALGDGDFRLRCMSKSGSDKIRVISQLEFSIQGLGQAYYNPYEFIAGSLYSSFRGEVGNGNEKGVATARDGESVVSYSNIDFGKTGSDEITVPIFALSDAEFPIQIWRGIPGEADGELVADVIYQKPMIWNVYQPETWKLDRKLTGINTISFLLCDKVHIKGFSFTPKAWQTLRAGEADTIYGDSFTLNGQTVEDIGNNVSLQFNGMDFGDDGATSLIITGRCGTRDNTIHVRFIRGDEEIKQIVEFPQCEEWKERCFTLDKMTGVWDVTFVFLPGSKFDFDSFRFVK